VWPTGIQGLVQRHAERELIASSIGRLPAMLLWCHVDRGPQHGSIGRELVPEQTFGQIVGLRVRLARRATAEGLRVTSVGRVASLAHANEAEVEHSGATIGIDHDVAGFEVTMNEPGRMCGG